MELLFAYDFVCPYAYLAFTQLSDLEQRRDVKFEHVPVLLRGFYARENSGPPYRHPNRGDWTSFDLRLWADYLNITMVKNSSFPFDSVHLMRGSIIAQEVGCYEEYVRRVFNAVWEKNTDLSTPERLFAWLVENELPDEPFRCGLNEARIKDQLYGNLDRVYKLGGFGTPSFFLNGQLYFGLDRMRFLDKAISHSNPLS